MTDRPKFKKAGSGILNPFSDLGVELSKQLPTYDVPIDLIEPNPKNPNEMNDDEFNRLVEELEEVDFVDPIQIVPFEGGKFRIIGGEHRWRGAKALGRDTVPCNILTDDRFLDPDLQDLLLVRMNVLHGKINPEAFQKLYKEKVDKYGADQLKTLFGYTSMDAWKKVTKGLVSAVKTSGIPGSGKIAEEIARRSTRVKSVDGLGNILKGLMRQYGEDLKHGFMFFVYGGKRHLYIIMNDALRGLVEEVVDHCRGTKTELTDAISDAINIWLIQTRKKEKDD